MRKRLLLSFLAGLAALAVAPSTAWTSVALPERFDPNRDAAADLQHALALAQAQRKLVLLDVGGEWCAWCHILDRFIAAHPEVLRTLQDHYVVVKVNWSPQNRNEQLLSRWPRPSGYPHFYVLDGNGQLLASQPTGELEGRRDYDEQKMLAFLRRHAPARPTPS